jgi:GH24 family phage-related lysozyme (muramidase)
MTTATQVATTSGHSVECATSALEQAHGDEAGALARLDMWGKSCGRHCLPGTDLVSRYAARRAARQVPEGDAR